MQICEMFLYMAAHTRRFLCSYQVLWVVCCSLWQDQVHQALITNRGCLTRQELLSLQVLYVRAPAQCIEPLLADGVPRDGLVVGGVRGRGAGPLCGVLIKVRVGAGYLRRWSGVQEDSVASWVESEEKHQISAIVSDVDMWLSRCREAIAAPNADPSMPLKDMLSRVRGRGPVHA